MPVLYRLSATVMDFSKGFLIFRLERHYVLEKIKEYLLQGWEKGTGRFRKTDGSNFWTKFILMFRFAADKGKCRKIIDLK